jgi:hypothetical protein
VLELRPRDVGVITCVGDPASVDAVGDVPGTMACRVAPDEAMLLSAPDAASEAGTEAARRATVADPDAIVLDATDGWAAWTLRGDGVDVAFARLSAVPLRLGFSQGDVAHVPVKIVVSDNALTLLVPIMWRMYLRERILARCAGLQVQETTQSLAWTSQGDPAA